MNYIILFLKNDNDLEKSIFFEHRFYYYLSSDYVTFITNIFL